MKHTIKNYKNIIVSFFALLGGILTLAESVHYMFNTTCIYEWMHNWRTIIIPVCVVIAFLLNKAPLKYKNFLENSDIKIIVKVQDILRSKSTGIVVPTNTTFDTLMENDFISINSIQGQFQNLYFKNNLQALDCLLEKELNGRDFIAVERANSKKRSIQ